MARRQMFQPIDVERIKGALLTTLWFPQLSDFLSPEQKLMERYRDEIEVMRAKRYKAARISKEFAQRGIQISEATIRENQRRFGRLAKMKRVKRGRGKVLPDEETKALDEPIRIQPDEVKCAMDARAADNGKAHPRENLGEKPSAKTAESDPILTAFVTDVRELLKGIVGVPGVPIGNHAVPMSDASSALKAERQWILLLVAFALIDEVVSKGSDGLDSQSP